MSRLATPGGDGAGGGGGEATVVIAGQVGKESEKHVAAGDACGGGGDGERWGPR